MVVERKANTVVDPLLPLQCYGFFWLKFGLGVFEWVIQCLSIAGDRDKMRTFLSWARRRNDRGRSIHLIFCKPRPRPDVLRRRRHKISELLRAAEQPRLPLIEYIVPHQPGAAMTTTSKNEGDQAAAAASVKKKAELMEWVEKRKAEGAKSNTLKATAAKPFSDGCADLSSIKGWYASQGLPWSNETAAKLGELGVDCVDDIKYLDQDAIDSLFKDEKPVIKGKVKAAWKRLEDDDKHTAAPMVMAAAEFPQETKRDVESQEGQFPSDEMKVPKLSVAAGISIALSTLGLIFGIVSCVKGDQVYDCVYNLLSSSYNSYYDDYYTSSYNDSSSGCDPTKVWNVAKGMGVTSFVLFALATPLAFYAGRAHLPSKTREEVRTNQACANPRCCPFNMALYAWIFFVGALAWGLAFCIIFYGGERGSSYSSYNYYNIGTLYASVLVPNLFAWSLMFGYAEMVRKYKDAISLCC